MGGVTAAWLAWQLAALMGKPLFTAVETGDFAAWHVNAATWQGEAGVVYTGREPNATWQHARVRIWVTTLDPAHVAQIPNDATHLVVNRVPDGFPVEPEVGDWAQGEPGHSRTFAECIARFVSGAAVDRPAVPGGHGRVAWVSDRHVRRHLGIDRREGG